ncbi:hypothetical protein AAF712_014125 [Marasmius tenuissimus]|uniref:Type 1 phosphatases regulator n=1 Tax=Marasmius tenuissimus TaxID=585030 RepID=A0ABR2ZCV9_9AGAR
MSYRPTQRATQRRPNTSAPGDGSRTITLTGAPPREEDDSGEGSSNDPPVGTLKLRGATRKTRQRVVWSDDVVDNEGCGRKSSKICCIYHKPKAFDESSSEEDSDSDSDDSCGGRHNHSHRQRRSPGGNGGENLQSRENGSSVVQLESDDSDKNAYEIAPSSKKGKHKAGGAGMVVATGPFEELGLSIVGIGVQYPPYATNAGDLENLSRRHYPDSPAMRKVLSINRNTGILHRSSIVSPEHPFINQSNAPSIAALHDMFTSAGVPLAVSAARKAIEEARIDVSQITHVVATTCTDSANPGFDHLVVKQLGITHRGRESPLAWGRL